MDRANYIAAVMHDPTVRGLKRTQIDGNGKIVFVDYPVAELKEAVSTVLDLALSESCVYPGSQNFDFLMDETDLSGGSVAAQSEYTLDGKTQDCRAIVTVKYGADFKALLKKEGPELDRLLTTRSVPSTPSWWISTNPVNGFPTIKIIPTPTISGETIRYRYVKKNILIEEWPGMWNFVLISGAIKRLVPGLAEIYKSDILQMIAAYEPSHAQEDSAALSEDLAARFRSLNARHGY